MRFAAQRLILVALVATLAAGLVRAESPGPDDALILHLKQHAAAMSNRLDRLEAFVDDSITARKAKAREVCLWELGSLLEELRALEVELDGTELAPKSRSTLRQTIRDLELRLSSVKPRLAAFEATSGTVDESLAGDPPSPLAPPANDACADATPIGDGTFSGDTTEATNDGNASCGSSATSPDAWFKYTASADVGVAFDTIGSPYDTVLSLHSGCPGTTANELTCNDDDTDLQSLVGLGMTTGEEVWVRVAGYAGDTGSFTLNVAPAGIISGTVTEDGTGNPIPDVEVDIFDSGGSGISYAYTDATGNYSFPGLSSGSYYACAYDFDLGHINERYDDMPFNGSCNPTSGTAIGVTAPAETGGIDFALVPGGSISGTVTEDGTVTPIQSVLVRIYNSSGSSIDSDWTATDGTYSIGGLLSGTYYACAFESNQGYINERYDDMPFNGSCNPTSGTAIGVTAPAETGGIDFALAPGGSISGTVTEEGTGTPIQSVLVRIYNSSGSSIDSDSTATDGTYSIGGLLSGTYYACAFESSQGYVNERYDDMPFNGSSCNPTSGTAIGVTAPTDTGSIDFALTQAGSISGTVSEVGTGTPLPDVDVDIYDSSGVYMTYGYSDGTGSYAANLLPPGTYYAIADTSFSGTHRSELYHNIDCESGCVPTNGAPIVVVAPLNIGGIDFALTSLAGCTPSLLLDGPPIDDVGLALEGCNSVLATGPFGIESPGSVTIRSGGSIAIGNGFYVEAGAACILELDPSLAVP